MTEFTQYSTTHFKAGTRQPALTVAGDRSAGLISASWKSKSIAVLSFYTEPKREVQKIKKLTNSDGYRPGI